MNKNLRLLLVLSLLLAYGCKKPSEVDTIIYNATVYTVDDDNPLVSAFAIKEGKIVATGADYEIKGDFVAPEVIDMEGKAVFPGFYDAHCHFVRYGLGLTEVNLEDIKSKEESLKTIAQFAEDNPDRDWIVGWGWNQTLWEDGKDFPSRYDLDAILPDKPVFLIRVDGHAAWLNSKALEMAGIDPTEEVSGGAILTDESGNATGILVDKAMDPVKAILPEANDRQLADALLLAEQNTLAVGLTSMAEAGLDKEIIFFIDSLQEAGQLKSRFYTMINPTEENMDHFFKEGPMLKDRLTARAFKIYGDGALGSRGACLLAPYHDHATHGFLLSSPERFEELAVLMNYHDFQMNTHCIGDSTNRILLDIYARVLKGENDKRWRIEHAQVVNPEDRPYFAEHNIIPSVQPTHAISDMNMAQERLGPVRIFHAYAYRSLLETAGILALGSDFPVEKINPLDGFHAAVARKDKNNQPINGFIANQAISREDALKGMTIWAAYSGFEEEMKGSLSPGKFADFVVLDRDIMSCDEEEIRGTSILETFINGERVYKK